MSKQGNPLETKRPEPSTTYGVRKGTAFTSPTHVAKRKESDAAPEIDEKLATAASPTSILIYSGATGGTIDPNGALKASIPVSATGGQVLVTNPFATATGGVVWSATAGKAAPVNLLTELNPAGVSGSSPLMQGLGSTLHITPASSGNIVVSLYMFAVNSTVADGVNLTLVYGTGSIPANQGPAVGTAFAPAKNIPTSNTGFPVSLTAIATGLTVGTQYWFDIQLLPTGGGEATLSEISGCIYEL